MSTIVSSKNAGDEGYRPGPDAAVSRFERLIAECERTDASGPDAEFLRLGRAFADAIRVFEAASDEDFAEAYDAVKAVAARIAALPARSLVGMRAKAIAFAWMFGGDDADGLTPEFGEASDVRLAASIARDLLTAC